MESMSERIKKIRKTFNLTSQEFADIICCDRKSIQRYENGDSIPNTYILKRISLEFGISTDYILGLSNEMKIKYEAEDVALLYQRYKELMNNKIQEDEEYYWITMQVKEDREYITSVQTEWIGYTDEPIRREIRRARAVIPENVIKLCKQINRPIVIINKISEIGLLYLFGGEAIIRKSLCEEHLSNILEPIIV